MKLLYAEDESALSEAVVDYLTYHKYIVDAVFDGATAYNYAISGDCDGIILDIMYFSTVKYYSQLWSVLSTKVRNFDLLHLSRSCCFYRCTATPKTKCHFNKWWRERTLFICIDAHIILYIKIARPESLSERREAPGF